MVYRIHPTLNDIFDKAILLRATEYLKKMYCQKQTRHDNQVQLLNHHHRRGGAADSMVCIHIY